LSAEVQEDDFMLVDRTIIFPVVLYECETWSLTWREEQRFSVFENGVLKGIFGSKRDEMTEGWIKLLNRMIRLRRMTWTGLVVRMRR
jgi:hypothetical protein